MFKPHIYQHENFGENWFTYRQLYTDIVRRFPSGSTFVEVGSWKGKSTAYMAIEIANSQKNIDFYCVDIWEPKELYQTFLENMSPITGFFKSLKMKSEDAASLFDNETLDFVFIDASHEYEDVKNDIKCWLPKVRKNGILAGHDYQTCFPGVKKAVIESFATYRVDVAQRCFIYTNT